MSIRKRIWTTTKGEERTAWVVDYVDQQDKRRLKTFARKKDADAWLHRTAVEVQQGTHIADSASTTVEQAAQAWLNVCAKRRDAGLQMEAATYAAYRSHIRQHIVDPEIGIGRLKLSRLARRDVNSFRDRLLANGRSEAMTRKALTTLRLILSDALDNQLIGSNAADHIRVLRSCRTSSRLTIPSKEEIRRLIDAASEDLQPLLIVSALCGLRASEARGLTWEHVDFQNGYINVRQRADRYNKLGEPKSAAAVRDVPIGPMVANTLRRWRLRCPMGDLGLVFPSGRGTVRSHENTINRHFKPLCQAHGIEMRWHDLRHFAVSLWIEQDFSAKAVMEFAGHSSINLTMDRYGHLFPSPEHHASMAEVEVRLLG